MQCHEFEQYLDQWAEDQLPADAAAHLNDCGQCRAMVSDMEAILAAARQLTVVEAEPPERVWLALRAQLESEGLIRMPSRTPEDPGWLGRWWQVFPRPALAGVYLALLLAAVVLFGLRGNLRENQAVRTGEAAPSTASVDRQLSNVERKVSTIHQHDPAVLASLQQNLDIVDNSIALCEKSVREEPQNELAREYLYDAYQQKAELLAAMMDRGTPAE